MPIKIPDALPATAILESENIFVMTEYRALHQDIRPLKVLILNLMPTKIVTETQILRKAVPIRGDRSRWNCCARPATSPSTPTRTTWPPFIPPLTR